MLLQMALFLLIANSSCLKLAHECKHDTAGGRTRDVTLSFPGPGSCVLAVSGPAGAHQGRPCLVQGEARPFQAALHSAAKQPSLCSLAFLVSSCT